MTITQNKLTPILVVFAALIVAYVIYVKATAPSAPVASGTPMASVPQPGVTAASAPKAGNGLFGGSTLPLTRSGDADNNAETLTTVTQSNKELRAAVQIVIDDNAALKRRTRRRSTTKRRSRRGCVHNFRPRRRATRVRRPARLRRTTCPAVTRSAV